MNSKNNQKRYAIVCYLENEHFDKVRKIQNDIFNLTGSKKCLDSWTPHLTIGSGVLVNEDEQENFEKLFQELADKQDTFETELSDFGGTENFKLDEKLTPYVLWINVVVNEKLQKLFNDVAEKITSKYETYWPRIINYNPHVTVAYGDLNFDGYKKGLEYLSELKFSDTIKISHIALVENFPDKDIEYKKFYFKY